MISSSCHSLAPVPEAVEEEASKEVGSGPQMGSVSAEAEEGAFSFGMNSALR